MRMQRPKRRLKGAGNMKLTNAKLCCNCDEVFEQNQCPVCTSSNWLLVSRLLNREVDDGK